MDLKKNNYGFGITARPIILLAEMFGVTACILILYWCIHYNGGLAFDSHNKTKIFNVHPVFMFVGFIFLSSQAILAYKIIPAKKEVQKTVHLVLLGTGIILGAIGIYAVFKYHNESNIKNMYSLHSWLGIGTICLFGLQWISALLAFVFPGASQGRRDAIYPWHVFLGVFLYAMVIGTAELGILERLSFQELLMGLDRFSSQAMLVNSTGLVILIFAMLIVLSTVLP